jgi:hypothetical protein
MSAYTNSAKMRVEMASNPNTTGRRRRGWVGMGIASVLTWIAFGVGDANLNPAVAAGYNLFTFDKMADGNFNQLLGINNSLMVVGYDGDGAVLPNKGYMLVPVGHYADENFPNSAQTQVIGINNLGFPVTVGFWADANGNNFGFTDRGGAFVSVQHPGTPTSGGVKVNQLLGVNLNDAAVGFYLDANGNSHGYVYAIVGRSFQNITLGFSKVVSVTPAGINDSNLICGSYSDGTTTHGFYGTIGNFVRVDIPHATATTFFGTNNKGVLVGFATIGGVSNGIIYNTVTKKTQIFNAPLSSSTTAFGVNGTTINGINDQEDLVGFYSDGTKVHGFLAVPAS